MKFKMIVYYVLMFLPLIVILVLLPFLPDQIPMHYGFDNQVTRWGSKYEAFIFPAVTILMGLFLPKQEATKNNSKNIVITSGIGTLIIFNVMTYFFLFTSFNQIENLSSVSIEISQIIFAIIGVLLIIVGFLMPKLPRNSLIGIRTVWSIKNEITWKKSQQFGKITFILSGIVIILISFFCTGWKCFGWSLVVILISVIVNVIYTYRIFKKHC